MTLYLQQVDFIAEKTYQQLCKTCIKRLTQNLPVIQWWNAWKQIFSCRMGQAYESKWLFIVHFLSAEQAGSCKLNKNKINTW